MMRIQKTIRIIHKSSGEVIAEGLKGWGMFAFEGNYYISQKNLKTNGFKFSGVPGLCFYKFVYFWYHFVDKKDNKTIMLGWRYWLPNPIFPFIAFRLAVSESHPELLVEEI